MPRVSLLAVVLVALGSVGAAGAYGQVAALELRMIGPQWQTYQAIGGAVLVGLGLIAFLLDLLKPPEPVPSISAQDSFLSKPKATPRVRPPAPVSKSAQEAASAATEAALVASSAEAPELSRIEQELRDVKRQINKAGVMLGTGQLSREGYKEYVADLKTRRGALEAELVRIELERARGGSAGGEAGTAVR